MRRITNLSGVGDPFGVVLIKFVKEFDSGEFVFVVVVVIVVGGGVLGLFESGGDEVGDFTSGGGDC